MFREHRINSNHAEDKKALIAIEEDESVEAEQAFSDQEQYFPPLRSLSPESSSISYGFDPAIFDPEHHLKTSAHSSLTPYIKHTGRLAGGTLTFIGSGAVAAHFILGMYELMEYIKKHTGAHFSAPIVDIVVGVTGVSCYVASFCLNGKNAVEVIQSFLQGAHNRCFGQRRAMPSRYSKLNLALSVTTGIPVIAATALASFGLSYGGTKQFLSATFSIADRSSVSLDCIIFSSMALASVDYLQTLFTEGRHTVEGLQEIFAKTVEAIKYISGLATQGYQKITAIPPSVKTLMDELWCSLQNNAADPDQMFDSLLQVLISAGPRLLKAGKVSLVVLMAGILPITLSLIGASATGAQFYFGIDCIAKLIEDLFLIQNPFVQSIVRKLFGSPKGVTSLVGQLAYPSAIAAAISSFFLNGRYLIIKTIVFEKLTYRYAAQGLYEFKYFYHRYANPNELESYAGIFSQIYRPSGNDIANLLVTCSVLLPMLGMVLCYATASSALTFVSMNEIVASHLGIKVLVAVIDWLQSVSTESGPMFEAVPAIAGLLKWMVAKIATVGGYGDCMQASLTTDEETNDTEDDEDEYEISAVLINGMRFFLEAAPEKDEVNKPFYGGSDGSPRPLLFSAKKSHRYNIVQDDKQELLALNSAIGYDSPIGNYGTQ